jgi:carotene biosynthesis associated membrane protein
VIRACWAILAILVTGEICYPLTSGGTRAALVVTTVLIGFALSFLHAATTRGLRNAAVLVAVTLGGGFLVEVLGVATGFPFGRYAYSDALGPKLLDVPLVIPLAWAWMAWPAWLAAGRLTTHRWARVSLAGLGLAAWDLFLDPQMVAAGYWRWTTSASVTLEGVPLLNYAGWLFVSLAMMALLSLADRLSTVDSRDAPMLVLYLWTYYSSVLSHAVFLDLPGSAAWGGIAMGAVAVPLTVVLFVRSPR